MDPLSITLSVLSLLKTASTVYTTLKDLYDGAATADTRVTALLTEVATFSQVIQLLKDTLESDQIRTSFQTTGHIGNHWNNLATLLVDCETILVQLQETLGAVNKSVGLLNSTRKHFRLKNAFPEIGTYQQQIRSYRDTVQLTLQTVILWNQVTSKEATDQILPSLDDLYQAIRQNANDITIRMASLENAVDGRPDDDQLLKLGNLRNCVRSAASIVSSASTTLGISLPDANSSYGSEFGDVFPPEQNEAMRRWVSSHTVYEFEEEDTQSAGHERKKGKAPVANFSSAENSQESQSDSDNDLEMEIIHSLYKRGDQSLESQDFKSANRLFLNCMNRISRSSAESRNSMQKMYDQVIGPLILTHEKLDTLDEAAAFLRKRISTKTRGMDNRIILSDTLRLVELLVRQKSNAEALLYGRRALKGYRRLGPSGKDGVERALVLIIEICQADDNYDDLDAYSAMLSDSRDNARTGDIQKAVMSSHDEVQLSDHLGSLMSLPETNSATNSEFQAGSDSTLARDSSKQLTAPLRQTIPETVPQLKPESSLNAKLLEVANKSSAMDYPSTYLPRHTKTHLSGSSETSIVELNKEHRGLPNLSAPSNTSDKHTSGDDTTIKTLSAPPGNPKGVLGHLDLVKQPEVKAHERNEFEPKELDPPILNSSPPPFKTVDNVEKIDVSSKDFVNTPIYQSFIKRSFPGIRAEANFPPETSNASLVTSQEATIVSSNIHATSGKFLESVHEELTEKVPSIGGSDKLEVEIEKTVSPTKESYLINEPAKHNCLKRKVVIVGDSACGKTSFYMRLLTGEAKHTSAPTVFGDYVYNVLVDGTPVELSLWDVGGLEDYDRLRPVCYPDTHLVFVCFSIGSPDSLLNVEDKWIGEISHFMKDVPIVLLGLQKDLREKPELWRLMEWQRYGYHAVTPEEGQAVADKIGASFYMECSAETGEGIVEIAPAAVRELLEHPGKMKARKAEMKAQKAAARKEMLKGFGKRVGFSFK